MNLDETVFQFNQQLDRLLGIGPRHMASTTSVDPGYRQAMETAQLLIDLNLGAEAAPPPGLAKHWKQHTRKANSPLRFRPAFRPGFAWIAALVIGLILLAIFHQPVFAAVERFFGYIYMPEMGFLPIRSTLVLEQPVTQEHEGVSLTVTQAVTTPQKTTVLLEFSGTAGPGDGALLEIGPDSHLALVSWEYVPNTPGSHGLKLNFPPLPAGITQTTLVLPAGWHLPLNWIPAGQSSLTDVQAVPYPIQTTGTAIPSNLCVEKNGLKLCLKAAVAEPDKTSLLVEATATNPALIPGGEFGLVRGNENPPITLRDAQEDLHLLDTQEPPVGGVLLFPPITGTHRLTLTIPTLLARVDIPDQSITVDLGDDPQPNSIIPVDGTIQVLGSSVHFSQATLDARGNKSLRLMLNADDPVQTVDGITPWMVEIGRPEGINDRYGWEDFGGTQDIHIELIQGDHKVTGKLTIPVISATVLVSGPFEFTFDLADFPAVTPTPLVANPNTFLAAASATPMSMDGYSYSGGSLQSGDLLYAVWPGDRTDLYRYHPGNGTEPELFLTLPGNVSSLSLHKDLLGMDYLAGKYDPDTNSVNPALYSLRFSDPAPRLLPLSIQGNITYPTWSAEGRFLAFGIQLAGPGEYMPRIGWVDLRCRDTRECAVNLLDAPLDYQLFGPQFSPQGDWLAINGADLTYGAGEIYLLQLDQNGKAGLLQNVTNTGLVFDGSAGWINGNRLVWQCTETVAPNPDKDHQAMICSQEISAGNPVQKILYGYGDYFFFGFSDEGNYFWRDVIDRTVPNGYQLWLHDLAGADRLLIEAPTIGMDYGRSIFSADERWLAYTTSGKVNSLSETLHIAATSTGETVQRFTGLNAIGWLGWVP